MTEDLYERVRGLIEMSKVDVSTGGRMWTYVPPECECEEVHRADCPTQAPQYTFEIMVDAAADEPDA